MAIWISRYSNKELQSGKYYPVGISIGTPKFPLGYTLRKQCYSLAPKGYMLNMELDRFKPAYYENCLIRRQGTSSSTTSAWMQRRWLSVTRRRERAKR